MSRKLLLKIRAAAASFLILFLLIALGMKYFKLFFLDNITYFQILAVYVLLMIFLMLDDNEADELEELKGRKIKEGRNQSKD